MLTSPRTVPRNVRSTRLSMANQRADFPDSGTNAGTGAWGKVETNNICNMPIPGCPDNLRIVGYGNPDYDCGAHIATVDNGLQNPDGIDTPYGKVIDIVEGPTGEYMSCTYGGRHEGNVGFTGGTSNYHAEVVCQGLACGGLYKNRKVSGDEVGFKSHNSDLNYLGLGYLGFLSECTMVVSCKGASVLAPPSQDFPEDGERSEGRTESSFSSTSMSLVPGRLETVRRFAWYRPLVRTVTTYSDAFDACDAYANALPAQPHTLSLRPPASCTSSPVSWSSILCCLAPPHSRRPSSEISPAFPCLPASRDNACHHARELHDVSFPPPYFEHTAMSSNTYPRVDACHDAHGLCGASFLSWPCENLAMLPSAMASSFRLDTLHAARGFHNSFFLPPSYENVVALLHAISSSCHLDLCLVLLWPAPTLTWVGRAMTRSFAASPDAISLPPSWADGSLTSIV